jgi:hypothetical protein
MDTQVSASSACSTGGCSLGSGQCAAGKGVWGLGLGWVPVTGGVLTADAGSAPGAQRRARRHGRLPPRPAKARRPRTQREAQVHDHGHEVDAHQEDHGVVVVVAAGGAGPGGGGGAGWGGGRRRRCAPVSWRARGGRGARRSARWRLLRPHARAAQGPAPPHLSKKAHHTGRVKKRQHVRAPAWTSSATVTTCSPPPPPPPPPAAPPPPTAASPADAGHLVDCHVAAPTSMSDSNVAARAGLRGGDVAPGGGAPLAPAAPSSAPPLACGGAPPRPRPHGIAPCPGGGQGGQGGRGRAECSSHECAVTRSNRAPKVLARSSGCGKGMCRE